MDGEIGCVLVNLLVKTIFTNIIYIFFLNVICYFFPQPSMVIKATKTSQSKRFRRRASTTRSILRRRRISRRVVKVSQVGKVSNKNGFARRRSGGGGRIPVGKVSNKNGVARRRTGGKRVRRRGGDNMFTFKATKHARGLFTGIMCHTNKRYFKFESGSKTLKWYVSSDDRKSNHSPKGCLTQVTSIDQNDADGTITFTGTEKDVVVDTDTIIDCLIDGNDCSDNRTYFITSLRNSVTRNTVTSVEINSIPFKIKVEKGCIITYLTEYPDELHKLISNNLIPCMLKLYDKSKEYNEQLRYFNCCGHNTETVCKKIDLSGFRNSKLIIQWETHLHDTSRIPEKYYGCQTSVIGAFYHALAYFEQVSSSHSGNDISIAIETVIYKPYKLQLYVGTKTEMKIILTTRYSCRPRDICYTFNCEQQWRNVKDPLFDS